MNFTQLLAPKREGKMIKDKEMMNEIFPYVR